MINNKKLNPIVTELFIRGRKLGISIVFITQSYFKVSKDIRLNFTHFFIMKIPNKRELQQIASNHSSDIDFKDFIKTYRKCKAFEKQTKTIKDHGEKQIEGIQNDKKQLANTQELTIKNIIPENIMRDEAKKEMEKIMEIKKPVDREKLIYRTSEYTHSFQNFQTIKSFGRDIYSGKITLKEADEDQANL